MIECREYNVTGACQGVGFRPLVKKLTQKNNLTGYVRNTRQGAALWIEGDTESCQKFASEIVDTLNVDLRLKSLREVEPQQRKFTSFDILHSSKQDGLMGARIPKDQAICSSCVIELREPNNRRYSYPFSSCVECGPRFSIVHSLPFDRESTSMDAFPVCDMCRAEYVDSNDRRFHAQTISCPKCGPTISMKLTSSSSTLYNNDAIEYAAQLILSGQPVLIKAMGGYQIMALASNLSLVEDIRRVKSRPFKPLALMFPNLDLVAEVCRASQDEQRYLCSAIAPIVLLKKHDFGDYSHISENGFLGVMLPYSALHILLVELIGQPVVVTSANLKGQPMPISFEEINSRIKSEIPHVLDHNLIIQHAVDDSVLKVVEGKPLILRRGRGLAPHYYPLAGENTVVALGGHQKASFAFSVGDELLQSQYLGDLSSEEARHHYLNELDKFLIMYRVEPECVVSDKHPNYETSYIAEEKFTNSHHCKAQHHLAHAASRSHIFLEDSLFVSWDGTGYGDDGSIWGGEFFIKSGDSLQRAASFLPFQLVGGKNELNRPHQIAFALAWQAFRGGGQDMEWRQLFESNKTDLLRILEQALESNVGIACSSAGRIFDGISYLCGVINHQYYEAQGAILLESKGIGWEEAETSPYEHSIYKNNDIYLIDWQALVRGVVRDALDKVRVEVISHKFHLALAHIVIDLSLRLKKQKVMLSGGVFQNALLCELIHRLAQQFGLEVPWDGELEFNDGGLCVGQANLQM